MRPIGKYSRLTSGLLLATALLAACDTPTSAPDLGPPPSASPVVIAKDSVAIPQGQSFQLAPASAAMTAGVWVSLDPSVVTVTAAGVAHAEHAGVGRVTYQSNDAHDTTTIVVPDPQVRAATVTVTMVATTLSVGMTSQAVAIVKDEHGATLAGRTIAWRSSNTTVAQVSASGVVTALATGSATIVARTNDDRSGSIVVTVPPTPVAAIRLTIPAETLAVSRTVQASGVALDAAGNELHDRRLTWSSANAAVARVSDGGLITAVAPGIAIISASIENIIKTDTLIVVGNDAPTVAAAIAVTLDSARLVANQTTTAHAVVRDAGGHEITRRVVWTSSDTTVARVTDGGAVTAKKAGSATITASVDGVSGSATLAVSSGEVHAITATLASSTVVVGGTTRATALVYDALQLTMPSVRVTWHSSDPSVATITDGGLVTALHAGTTTISASVGSIVGAATLVITAP